MSYKYTYFVQTLDTILSTILPFCQLGNQSPWSLSTILTREQFFSEFCNGNLDEIDNEDSFFSSEDSLFSGDVFFNSPT